VRFTVTRFLVPTLGGAVVYDVTCYPWVRGKDRLKIVRIVLDLTGY
jgi:hypothetical protein